MTLAKALIALDVPQDSTVNIIGSNSKEWAVAFNGCILGNFIPVGLYSTNGPNVCSYIANHSETSVIMAEDKVQLDKYIKVKDEIPKVKYFILFQGTVPNDL